MKIESLLRDEIKSEFEDIGKTAFGTDEYKTKVDTVVKLVDRAIEIDKLNMENDRQIEDMRLKEAQMEEDKQDRKLKNYIAIAGICLPLGVTIWGTFKTLKFEQEGTVTTMMGRGFINNLLHRK